MGQRIEAKLLKSHVIFRKLPRYKGYKTDMWDIVASADGSIIGRIGWNMPRRRYVLGMSDYLDIVFDASSLDEISAFIKKANQDHKAKLAASRAAKEN